MAKRPTRIAIIIDLGDMSDEDLRRFLVFIGSNKLVDDWHSPFRGFLIVESEKSIEKIEGSLKDYFDGKKRMFLTVLAQGSSRGFLARQTWRWLKRFDQEESTGQ